MTSRPAAPESPEDRETMRKDFERGVYERAESESETPETDLHAGPLSSFIGDSPGGYVIADLARSLERRLSLAQTEIKGHMRLEIEAQADYIRAREFIEQQSKRIAELEKDAASMSDGLNNGVCTECRGYRCHILPCRIWEISRKYLSEPPDAALKSRA